MNKNFMVNKGGKTFFFGSVERARLFAGSAPVFKNHGNGVGTLVR